LLFYSQEVSLGLLPVRRRVFERKKKKRFFQSVGLAFANHAPANESFAARGQPAPVCNDKEKECGVNHAK
jgi:hypothetical protein